MKDSDNCVLHQDESINSCLWALKEIILSQDKGVTVVRKYGMPFFLYNSKTICYLWVHKKYKQPYIGIMEGDRFEDPRLVIEKRIKIKIMLIDPQEDLPIEAIEAIIKKAIVLSRNQPSPIANT